MSCSEKWSHSGGEVRRRHELHRRRGKAQVNLSIFPSDTAAERARRGKEDSELETIQTLKKKPIDPHSGTL